jgi:hypothetical protein
MPSQPICRLTDFLVSRSGRAARTVVLLGGQLCLDRRNPTLLKSRLNSQRPGNLMEDEGQNPTAQKDLYMLLQAAIPRAVLIASLSRTSRRFARPTPLSAGQASQQRGRGNLGILEASGFKTALRQG